ncbi:hypothetical protein CL620_03510 [archaeon]|nr:hypothetical protein [archaeon]|tara:strand:+ start:375 stop:707 length:333 start_codon:yes stop_codon:yes gene_type:complete
MMERITLRATHRNEELEIALGFRLNEAYAVRIAGINVMDQLPFYGVLTRVDLCRWSNGKIRIEKVTLEDGLVGPERSYFAKEHISGSAIVSIGRLPNPDAFYKHRDHITK